MRRNHFVDRKTNSHGVRFGWSSFVSIAFVLVMGCDAPLTSAKIPIRMGYQKGGIFSILSGQGRLESALEPLGCRVEWIQFPAGPPLLEALNAGSIDFGHTGDSPPIFAQAAGVPLVYVAATTSCPEGCAIVVRADSSIQSLSDLRGKKVAYTRGSSAHTMVLRALNSVELSLDDIESVQLSMADARTAFETGGIDAWSTWDPYLSLLEYQGGVRLITSGEGLVPAREFYIASSDFLAKHREIVAVLLRELNDVRDWAVVNPIETAKIIAEQIGMDRKVLERAVQKPRRFGIESDQVIVATEQQGLADTFFKLGLLPRRIDVHSVIDFVEPAAK